MLNKDRYHDEIITLLKQGKSWGVIPKQNIVECDNRYCDQCVFYNSVTECDVKKPSAAGFRLREKWLSYDDGTPQETTTALKPCPFCGRLPEITCLDDIYMVQCKLKYCPAHYTNSYMSQKEAAEAWNERREPVWQNQNKLP